jgi:hypothetical protein
MEEGKDTCPDFPTGTVTAVMKIVALDVTAAPAFITAVEP